MAGSAYIPRWVQVRTVEGWVTAVTFVVNREYSRYVGKLSDAEAAGYIGTATGALGSCMAYLENTIAHLHALGIRDAGLQRIAARMITG